MNFADTNWLTALYIEPEPDHIADVKRKESVDKCMRRQSGQIGLSHVVLLESRNVFSRITAMPEPPEWKLLENDFGGRLYLDPMNWDLLRHECYRLFSRYGYKMTLGTFDTAVVASAKLGGATRLLSFDPIAKALAAAEGLEVFPTLDPAEKRLLAKLRA